MSEVKGTVFRATCAGCGATFSTENPAARHCPICADRFPTRRRAPGE